MLRCIRAPVDVLRGEVDRPAVDVHRRHVRVAGQAERADEPRVVLPVVGGHRVAGPVERAAALREETRGRITVDSTDLIRQIETIDERH